ncbi:MAG: ABC transporter permease [Clostridium sp.]
MYNAFKSLVKSKKIFVIAAFQLALGLSLLNYTSSLTLNYKKKTETLKTLFKIENTYTSKAILNDSDFNGYKVIEELEKMKKEGIVANYINYTTGSIRSLGNLEKALFGDEAEELFIADSYYCPFLNIDETIFNRIDIKVIEGRDIAEADFNKDYKTENIPIWLGIEHRGKVKVGDTFKERKIQKERPYKEGDFVQEESVPGRIVDDITFEIAGFLDYDQLPTFNRSDETFMEHLTYSNKIVLMPTVPEFMQYNEEFGISEEIGLFVELTDNIYLQEYLERFEKVCLENSFMPQVINLEEAINLAIGNLDRELIQTIILGISLTFLSIIGITATFLGYLNRRNLEFGIKLSQGASINTLIKEVFMEIVYIVFFAIVLSYIILNLKGATDLFTIGMLFRNILFLGVISIIILIPMIIKLKGFKIIDLIRGR